MVDRSELPSAEVKLTVGQARWVAFVARALIEKGRTKVPHIAKAVAEAMDVSATFGSKAVLTIDEIRWVSMIARWHFENNATKVPDLARVVAVATELALHEATALDDDDDGLFFDGYDDLEDEKW